MRRSQRIADKRWKHLPAPGFVHPAVDQLHTLAHLLIFQTRPYETSDIDELIGNYMTLHASMIPSYQHIISYKFFEYLLDNIHIWLDVQRKSDKRMLSWILQHLESEFDIINHESSYMLPRMYELRKHIVGF
jgi:hypothetical protein